MSLASSDDPVRYAELHCRSQFSFLHGASSPERLVEVAGQLGLEALALTDRHGFYGVVRFAQAAREAGVRTVFGAEVRCDEADASHGDLVIVADGPDGYVALSRALTAGQLRGKKSHPRFDVASLAATLRDTCWVLTGGADGMLTTALRTGGVDAAGQSLRLLVEAFGRDRVLVELWHHGEPADVWRNDAFVDVASRDGVQCVATNDVSYAVPADHSLATALAAVRNRCSLDELDPHLPPAAGACLRSGQEQALRFSRYPGVVALAADIGRAAAFDLSLIAPRLPPYPCPDGLTEIKYLRRLVEVGGRRRYGERPLGAHEDLSLRSRAWRTIDHELEIIEQLGFAGYFLVVWDIVQFCERSDILCQGRGSAANSAVCYSLGVTKADAVSLGLLFERFLSAERDGPPDIDLDIESDRREEVIQYVYERYGRERAAQVANVITYRARSAVRDMARALGYDAAEQDAFSRRFDSWSPVKDQREVTVPDLVVQLAQRVQDAPRHLGIHSGGMVICDRPVSEVCPVEWATMPGRSVLQWDKDDCAAVNLVKFDLLGLGMLSALHRAIDYIAEFRGERIDLATIPQEDDVYAMLCRADSVGVFQVESRAQMSTLPRLKPRRFYDLVVEVALIRPGPIQGGSVHPYIRRRNGQEPVTYLHPLLENSLGKTLGVPLFQEQLMQMAIDVAGFTPSQADELRQAMGSKRSRARMTRLRDRLFAGMAQRGITGEIADEIYDKMAAFANYGFPESHSVSFAYLVYASAWIKLHEPAIFCAALVNSQPMGFWSPHTLVQDARRHGVVVRTPDINASRAGAWLEPDAQSTGGLAVRLGIGSVRGIGDDLALRIEAARPFNDTEDLVRRVPGISVKQLEALSTAGVFGESFDVSRRTALWNAGAVAESSPDRLAGVVTTSTPHLPGMQPVEEAVADLWATGVSPDGHPTTFLRASLRELGVVTAVELDALARSGATRALVAGVVTHRQRPMTAKGTTFFSLEDETGLINVLCSRGCWVRHAEVLRRASALLVRGQVQFAEGVINVIGEQFSELRVPIRMAARDFR
ncbi:MAG: error-prone DNA polymerase [Actinobacteria bacterium]|nr:error-prone DNA polymerase [Actinomycetota bacterium]NBR76271.1 error-prone DNA polymerase [Actinomycetota bacterium]NBR92445.1 error-prone DNA polymerase [Actinomycetota bacterium]NBT20831.1 error-prone DNA polymerase [Actinomycetota bacterium]NBY58396.1 error-prone DNA polymerase [Actinomycetota bacterium]